MRVKISNIIKIHDYNGSVEKWCNDNLILKNPIYETLKKLGKDDTIKRKHIPEKTKNFVRKGNSIELPFGCLYGIWPLIKNEELELVFNQGEKISIANKECPVELFDYQKRAVDFMIPAKGGVLVSPCGSGKTFMGIEIIRRLGKKFLWLTHTGDLLRQTHAEFKALYPGIDIGFITEGKIDIGRDGAIATVQTLSKIDPMRYRDEFEVIVVDECAHCVGTPDATKMFSKVMENVPARYKYGLTATPSRSDSLIETMYALIGLSKEGKFEATYTIDKKEIKTIPAQHDKVALYTIIDQDSDVFEIDGTIVFNELINYLSFDEERNKIILDNIEECNKQNRKQVVLTLRVEHAQLLNEELKKRGLNSVCVTGKTKKSDREKFLRTNTNDWDILVSTYALLKEGINIKALDTLHLTVPQKDKALIVQCVGRIERFLENKKQPIVYDYVDINVNYCLNAYYSRVRSIKNRY